MRAIIIYPTSQYEKQTVRQNPLMIIVLFSTTIQPGFQKQSKKKNRGILLLGDRHQLGETLPKESGQATSMGMSQSGSFPAQDSRIQEGWKPLV